LINELIVADFTGGNNNHVLTIVIGSVVISKDLSTKVSYLISITLDWLSNLMFSVNIEVGIFHGHFFVVVETGFVLIRHFDLKLFNFCWVQLHVAYGITKEGNGSSRIFLMALKVEAGVFSV